MPQYLSQDPNAGLTDPAPTGRRYLSTDPNAGVQKASLLSMDASEPEIPEPPSLTGRVGSFVQSVGNVLGSTGDATATAVDQLMNKKASLSTALYEGGKAFFDMGSTTTDFDKVLENAGYAPGLGRATAGFIGDVVVDPINLLGAAPVKAISKAVGPIAALNKLTGSGELAGAAGRLMKKAGTTLEEAPVVKDVLAKFIEYPGLGTTMSKVDPTLSYRDMRRLGASKMRAANENAAELAMKRTLGIDEAQRAEIALALDEGRKLADPKLQSVADDMRIILDEQVKKDMAKGSLARNPVNKYRPNYVPHYASQFDNSNPTTRKVLHGITKSDSIGKDQGLFQYKGLRDAAKRAGAVTDIREIVGKRVAEGEKANANIDFVLDAVKHFGTTKAETGYRTLKPDTLSFQFTPKIAKQVQNVYFPERVAKDLERTHVLWSKDSELSKFTAGTAKLWKSLALAPPGHQFTNFLGNVANMNLGGMNMAEIGKEYYAANKWLKQLGNKVAPNPPKFGSQVVNAAGDLGIGKYANWEIAQALKKYEIFGTSSQLGELETAHNVSKVFKGDYNPISPDNKLFTFLRRTGQSRIEEPARAAFFVNRLRKGDSLEKAALKTKEYLFDYGELTDAEKKIKNLVPFYTWTRKNLPLQLRSIITSPERLDRHKDFLQLFQNAGDGDSFTQPDFLEDSGYVPSPIKGESGTPSMMRLALPMQDLGLIPNEASMQGLTESMKRAGSMGAPWAKVPLELAFGTEISGVPIERSTGVASPAPLASILDRIGLGSLVGMKDTPKGRMQSDYASYAMRQIPGFSWMASGIPGVKEDDPISGDNLPALWKILGTLGGLNPRLINPQSEVSEMQDRMNQYKKNLKRSLEP